MPQFFPEGLDILALVGIIILFAFLMGQIFRRIGIPQVVGFIVAGTLLGPSFLHIVPGELTGNLTFVTELALGLIGFEMGEHLRFDELRKLGRSIIIIVVLQAIGAFVLVASGVYLVTGSLPTALIFGAIAMATAPAATVDVLTEYGAEGPMTTSLLAVIGIDDALTLLVFSITAAMAEPLLSNGGSSLSDVLTGGGDISLVEMIEIPVFEIGGSILVGILFGFLLTRIMCHIRSHHAPERRQHDAMAVSIAVIFIATGLSRSMDLSLILTTMVMGIVVVNRTPRNGEYIRFTIEQAGPVVYVLFFALVGAGLDLGTLPAIGTLGLAYMILRIVGKYSGAWLGGYVAGTDPTVRDNLGLALLSQAGVAIGLALSVETRFQDFGPEGEQLVDRVVNVVTATTFVVQIIGPLLVKVAITRAGEIGKARPGPPLVEAGFAEAET
ncbi:MAG: cation:proton antiporter [Anaerolineae bacterium]|nr:cation:proton antiporter [Anaerolineae bacterium]